MRVFFAIRFEFDWSLILYSAMYIVMQSHFLQREKLTYQKIYLQELYKGTLVEGLTQAMKNLIN